MAYTLEKGRPADFAARIAKEQRCYDLLDSLQIQYDRIDHPAAATMTDCDDVAVALGCGICKNLFLCNRSGTKFYLLLICADKPFRTGDVSRQLGSSRLSFCSDAQLMDKLGLIAGSVTPMAIYRESARDVVVAIDEDIFDMNMVCVHPCVATASLAISMEDLLKYIGRTGNEIKRVHIE